MRKKMTQEQIIEYLKHGRVLLKYRGVGSYPGHFSMKYGGDIEFSPLNAVPIKGLIRKGIIIASGKDGPHWNSPTIYVLAPEKKSPAAEVIKVNVQEVTKYLNAVRDNKLICKQCGAIEPPCGFYPLFGMAIGGGIDVQISGITCLDCMKGGK